MLSLPAAARDAFKEPMGPVFTAADALLAAVGRAHERHGDTAGTPFLIAVGDVVTYHLLEAGRVPDVALVDGRTKREAVDEAIRDRVLDQGTDADIRTVSNPPGELSRELLAALADAVDADGPVSLHVDGEEDLAVVPALLVAPAGGSVVYGQPDEGMVHVPVSPQTRVEARTLLSRFDGDVDAALSVLGVDVGDLG